MGTGKHILFLLFWSLLPFSCCLRCERRPACLTFPLPGTQTPRILSQRQPHPTVFWKAQEFPLVITKTVMIMHIKKVQGLKIIQSVLQDYLAPYVNSISLLRSTDRLKTYGFLNTTRYHLLREFYSDSPNLLVDSLYLFP